MTPTTWGRIQTRILVALVVGLPVTALICALTDLRFPDGVGILAVLTVLGVGWELDYDALQRRRWDHDWPSVFVLLCIVPEALVGWPILQFLGLAPGIGDFVLQVGAIGMTSFLVVQGPLRVVLPHWRAEGGRVLPRRTRPVRPAHGYAPEPIRSSSAMAFGRDSRRWGLAGIAFLGLAAVAGLVMVAFGTGGHGSVAASDGPTSHPTEDVRVPSRPPARPAQVPVNHWDTSIRVVPVRLVVPTGSAAVEPVGLDSQRLLSAPSDASHVGWYAASPAPGQVGASVLTGSTAGAAAALDRLGSVPVGSSIVVQRSDGSAVVFKVTRVITVGVTDFPTRDVYTRTKVPSLRLIGAAGSGQNVRDIIVFAVASGWVPGHA